MGALKPLMPFRGSTLIDAVIARAAPQVGRLGIDVARGEEPLFRARHGETIVPDVFARKLGPLCGIVTGLAWMDAQWLATFPCDTPFLPDNLVAQLEARADMCPVVARHGGRVHGVCGLWPKSALARLKDGVESGALRSVRDALAAFDGVACDIDAPDECVLQREHAGRSAKAERL